MRSFKDLAPWAVGEVLTFLEAKARRTVSGVASAPVSVFVEHKGGSPILFQAFPAGQFSFEVVSAEPFNMWFEGPDDAVLSLVVPPHSTVVQGDIERTFTTVEHRPAINPAMAAMQRQLRDMQSQLSHAAMRAAAVARIDAVKAAEAQALAAAKAEADAAAAKAEADAAAAEAALVAASQEPA